MVAPEDPEHTLLTSFGYDAYSNVTSVNETGRDRQLGSIPHVTVTRSSCVSYEPSGTFPFAVRNAMGHTAYSLFDASMGVRLKLKDPNGLVATSTYDAFGWRQAETAPDGGKSVALLGTVTAGFEKRTRVSMVGADNSHVDVDYDARGRPIRKRSFVTGSTTPVTDIFSYVWRETGDTIVSHTRPSGARECFEHDPFGRLTGRRAPLLAEGTTYLFEGLDTIARDANLKDTRIKRDQVGRTTAVIDAKNGSTTYEYGPFDKVVKVTDASGHATVSAYDAYGRLTQAIDPDRGIQSYAYSSFGAVTSSFDGKQRSTIVFHDRLGREVQRITDDGTTVREWDTAPSGRGKLAKITGPGDSTIAYTYDSLGRTDTVTRTIAGEPYTLGFKYDGISRVRELNYPSNGGAFRVEYLYDAEGHLVELRDPAANQSIWKAVRADSAGRLSQEAFGDGTATTRTFDDFRDGVLDSLRTTRGVGPLGPVVIQDLTYEYDTHRNLTSRTDKRVENPHRETFCYDALDRLTDGAVDANVVCGQGTKYHFEYAADGNITLKSGVGAYAYSPFRPHAPTVAGFSGFLYDAVGNQFERPRPAGANPSLVGRETLLYTAFNKPRSVMDGNVYRGPSAETACGPNCYCTTEKGPAATGGDVRWCSDHATALEYDGEQQRMRKESPESSTIYVGGFYERITDRTTGAIEHKYFLRVPGRDVAIRTRRVAGGVAMSPTINYLHVDEVGSIESITDSNGAVLERRSYDPFGAPRNPNWASSAPPSADRLEKVGFSGHEEDRALGLINMKGREYDPVLGQFLSADPILSSPGFSQSWNRYSYVRNNPLTFVDPSGFVPEGGWPAGSGLSQDPGPPAWTPSVLGQNESGYFGFQPTARGNFFERPGMGDPGFHLDVVTPTVEGPPSQISPPGPGSHLQLAPLSWNMRLYTQSYTPLELFSADSGIVFMSDATAAWYADVIQLLTGVPDFGNPGIMTYEGYHPEMVPILGPIVMGLQPNASWGARGRGVLEAGLTVLPFVGPAKVAAEGAEMAAQLAARASALNATRGAWMAERGTTAVMVARHGTTGELATFVATESVGAEAGLAAALARGETFVSGAGHAEETILRGIGSDWTVLAGGTSRNICLGSCAWVLGEAGLGLGGSTFRGALGKTPFRMFWR